MTVLLFSIGLWCVVVFSIRVAVWGNPLLNLLQQADSELIKKVQAVVMGEADTSSEEEVNFLRGFSRLTLLEVGAFLLEITLLLWAWFLDTLPWLAFGLLIKDVLAIALSAVVTRSHMDEKGIFESMLALPKWVVSADRVSAFISAVGCLILFLEVNNLLPG